ARAAILPLAEKSNDDNDPNHFNWAAFDSSSMAAPFDFFQQMQARGVDRFVGSVWTAPPWMKTNNLNTDGGSLRPDKYAEFAEYLSAVTQIAKRDYGVNLMAISPQNEPYFVEPYESTTYTPNQLRETVRAVMRKFGQDGVTTKIILPEDLIFEDRNQWYLDRIMKDPETKNFSGAFSGHGLLTHWDAIRDLFAQYNREFWMTETSGTSGKTWEGAMGLGSSILNAIGIGNASTYIYWQFSDSDGNSSKALMTDGVPNTKYAVAKQFFRWIRPGFVHVGATSSADTLRVATFKNPATGALTTVVLNTGDAADVTFDLAGSNLPGTYKIFRSSSTEQTAPLGTITGGAHFTLTIPGSSAVTITSAPELTPPTAATAGPANVNIQGV